MREGFVKHLAKLWNEDFSHSYAISRHGSWKQWRAMSTYGANNSAETWYCNSLSQANDHYSWTIGKEKTTFETLSVYLKNAIEEGDGEKVRVISEDIFDWGGVGRSPSDPSCQWLVSLEPAELLRRLREARDMLRDPQADLSRFDGKYLLMNSAMTKVYAASDPKKLAIYDGRVGAALGLLARDYLRAQGEHGPVPEGLRFLWGASRVKLKPGAQSERNPSEDELRFPSLFGVGKDRAHATMMRDTSSILRDVERSISDDPPVTVFRLDQALFMIGYDVSRSGGSSRDAEKVGNAA